VVSIDYIQAMNLQIAKQWKIVQHEILQEKLEYFWHINEKMNQT
jgi:hypothetical protein